MTSSEPILSKQTLSRKHLSLIEDTIVILLIILSLAGIAVMNFSPADGYWYWVAMIFVFGIAAMTISLMQTERREHIFREIWLEQSLHWGGVILCLCGTLLLLYRGVLDDQSTGLVMLLVLSLATYLDGIRIGWRFSLVGNYLGLTAVVIAFLDNFMWALFGLAAISIGFTIYWEKRQMARRS